MQTVYDMWRRTARWPLYGPLDATLDHDYEIELGSVLPTIPDGLLISVRIPSPSDDSEVKLTISGIDRCRGGQAHVDLFLRALKWCVRRQREHIPDSHKPVQLRLTSEEAARDWAAEGASVSAEILTQAFSLLTTENIAWGSSQSGDAPFDWSVGIHREIRKYRGVNTLGDYLRIKQESMSAAVRPHRVPVVVPRVQPRHHAAVQVFSSGIPEPGPGLALEDLHPAIRDTASSLFAARRYRQGVLDAGLAVRDAVRARTGLGETNDSTLMGKAFGGKTPLVEVADMSVPTGQNIQRGIAHLAEAIIAAVRNRLTHESPEIPVADAMEMLAMMSHLLRLVDDPWRPVGPPPAEAQ